MENKEKTIGTTPNDRTVYEIGFHIVPVVAESDLGARVTAMRDIIEENGGHIISDEYPKHMDLAYPMAKMVSNKRSLHNSAYFGWVKFEVEAKNMKAIEAACKADAFILRFLAVKTVRENTMTPKKVLMKRGEEGTTKPEEKVEEKPQLTEEELDKTIEDLVIS